VYEILETTEEVKKAVLEKADEATVFAIARKNGMLTLKEDAIVKAMRKQIPFEEVAQVGGVMDLDETPESTVEEVVSEDETSMVERAPVESSGHDLI
jgi:hypothetical protein